VIAHISGTLAQKIPGEVVIDVAGVGYQVFIPLNVFYRLPEIGAPLSLQIYTHVREDALQLFGFQDIGDKQLFLLLLGVSGIGPKLAIVALICFFPITVNLLDGLRATPPELLKLMRSMGASRLRTLRSVELPAALPSLFSGLKIAATVSVIGAVFGEWAGADEGLGRLVLLGNNQLQTPRVYAGIVILTLMAVGLFALAALAERVAVPWNRKDASG